MRPLFGYSDPFWIIGPWELMLHDSGWIVCRDQIVRLEGTWPTWKTFHREPRP